jgi:hypothetical protein
VDLGSRGFALVRGVAPVVFVLGCTLSGLLTCG